MSTKIKKSTVGFYFQGKHLLGIYCVEKAEKDLAGVIFAKWTLKLILILVSNAHLRGGFGQKSRTS